MTTQADALVVMAGLVMEDGRRWGEVATPWQFADAEALLDPDPDAPRWHYWTRPRGGSKTADAGGASIAALAEQLPRLSRGYAFAADREQAGLWLDSVAGFLDRTGGLSGMRVTASGVVNDRTEATIEVMSSDDASAWGLRPAWVVVDEFAQWPPGSSRTRRLWTAILSAMPKPPRGRLLAITSAGDPAHMAAQVLRQARASDWWRVSEQAGPVPWLAERDLEELKATLLDFEYERLVLNRWTEGEGRLATVDGLEEMATLDGPLPPREGVRYVVGVDLGVKSDRTVAAVCHAEHVVRWLDGRRVDEGTRVVLDRMAVWEGTRRSPVDLGQVEEWLAQAAASYGARVVMDPWQAIAMAQRLRERRVQVEEFTFTQASVGRLAMTLHRLLSGKLLALPRDPDLLDELANVRLVEKSPGVVRMDHDHGRHDDRAVAIALAAQALLSQAPVRPIGVTHWRHAPRPDRDFGSPVSAEVREELHRRAWQDPDLREHMLRREAETRHPLYGRR